MKALAVTASSISDISLRTRSPVQRIAILRWQTASCSAACRTGDEWIETDGSRTLAGAAQWMPPVDPPRSDVQRPHVVKMAMFLPQFVGEKKRDDKQRNNQKDAQYQLLDHGGLRSQEHEFIVEHCPSP
jgi:hypothetical protein